MTAAEVFGPKADVLDEAKPMTPEQSRARAALKAEAAAKVADARAQGAIRVRAAQRNAASI